jgi:hypothetical protein
MPDHCMPTRLLGVLYAKYTHYFTQQDKLLFSKLYKKRFVLGVGF